MKIPATFILAMLPILVAAQQKSWLFETTSGRAQGVGTRSCQRFYMKRYENWTVKLEPTKKNKARSADPQGGWGDSWGNTNSPPLPQNGGGWNPVPDPAAWVPLSSLPPSSGGGWTPVSVPPQNNGGGERGWTPPPQSAPSPNRQPPPHVVASPPSNSKPPPQTSNGGPWNGSKPPTNNGGQWNGPVAPPPSVLKCCVRMYSDDSCKDIEETGCVSNRDDKRYEKGRAAKDARSFNVVCT